jgi:hypothetical protein
MDLSIILNIIFGLTTVTSFLYAIKENKAKARAKDAEERLRRMYKTTCRSKCITIAGTASDLAQSSNGSCRLIKQCTSQPDEPASGPKCIHATRLTGLMYSIRTATNHLIDFCKVLNDEYKSEFNEPIIEDFESEVPRRLCEEDW